MAGFLDFLVGTKGKIKQAPLYSRSQQQAMKTAARTGLQGIKQDRPYDFSQLQQQLQQSRDFGPLSQKIEQNIDFAPIQKQYEENFMKYTVPTIAERFAQSGGLHSSDFRNSLARGGAELNTNLASLGAQQGIARNDDLLKLAALQLEQELGNKKVGLGFGELRSNYGLKRRSLLQDLLNSGLQQKFQNTYRPGTQGFLQSLAGGLGSSVGQAGGSMFGNWFGSLFK